MQIQILQVRFLRWPNRVGMPSVRTALESTGLPVRLLPLPVQIVAKKRSLHVFAELAGGLVSSKRNDADAVALRALPFAVKPRPRNNEIGVVRVMLFGMMENLPGTPRIFLVPKTGDIQVRDR